MNRIFKNLKKDKKYSQESINLLDAKGFGDVSKKRAEIAGLELFPITQKNISKFLEDIFYDSKYGHRRTIFGNYKLAPGVFENCKFDGNVIYKDLSIDAISRLVNDRVRMIWRESKLEDVVKFTDENVIKKIAEMVNKFDFLTVAYVEMKGFDWDELILKKRTEQSFLLGRIEGCSDRFFITQWCDDIDADDIIPQ